MKQQSGTILAFCLVFLALLALMAISGMESILLHERMAANMRLSRDEFEAAEAALQAAEDNLRGQCPAAGMDFSETMPVAGAIWRQSVEIDPGWWEAHGVSAGHPAIEPVLAQIYVESWPNPGIAPDRPTPVYYRITARGSDAAAASAAILQVVGVAVCSGADTTAQTRLSWRQIS